MVRVRRRDWVVVVVRMVGSRAVLNRTEVENVG